MKTIEQAVRDADQQVRDFTRDLRRLRTVTQKVVEAKEPLKTKTQRETLEDLALVLRGLSLEARLLSEAIDKFRQL